MTGRILVLAVALLLVAGALSFSLTAPHTFTIMTKNSAHSGRTNNYSKHYPTTTRRQSSSLKMIFEDVDPNVLYTGMALVTIIPSVLFVGFVGKAADNSRDSISTESKNKFKRKMMETPGINLALPTSDEEALKKQIALAYMKDKDVDVAVLEQKLLKRAQWRKEMMAKARSDAAAYEDDEGW